ncbi:hypothetical protein RCH11_000959 [Glaciihabitans sp. GrIS 2.15]|nr:hypothetical protein [Glaciihabitans sp. GrIS 2.15]
MLPGRDVLAASTSGIQMIFGSRPGSADLNYFSAASAVVTRVLASAADPK